MDYTDIILAVIALLSAVLTSIVAPWIKAKLGNEKLSTALSWVEIAVNAAEQVYAITDGDAKKQYVVDFLRKKGVNFDSEQLDAAIEAAVLNLHSILKSE